MSWGILSCGNCPIKWPAMGPPNSQPSFCRQGLGVSVQLVGNNIRGLVKMLLSRGERPAGIIPKFVFSRIGTEHKGPSKIGFPLLEHRAKIQK
jgi:hypothetical protein